MEKKFKSYLEKEFRSIAPTREAMEYREEILGTLLDKADEYRIKGIEDEDLIYKICVESLGDLQATLKDFETKRTSTTKKIATAGRIGVIIGAAVLIFVATYLAVSFAIPNSWKYTWLILVGGAFFGVIGGMIATMPKLVSRKKYYLVRIETILTIVLLSVFAFIASGITTGLWGKLWTIMLAMVMLVFLVDTIISLITKSKIAVLGIIVTIMVVCVLSYVMIGFFTGMWHPLWLIILIGAIADLIVLAVYLKAKFNKKAETKKMKAEEDEQYFTKWSK